MQTDITENGCGMSQRFIAQKLFKPFRSTKSGGFGIGANEAREITRSLGGRLEVESREGAGSTFLPRASGCGRSARRRGAVTGLPKLLVAKDD